MPQAGVLASGILANSDRNSGTVRSNFESNWTVGDFQLDHGQFSVGPWLIFKRNSVGVGGAELASGIGIVDAHGGAHETLLRIIFSYIYNHIILSVVLCAPVRTVMISE